MDLLILSGGLLLSGMYINSDKKTARNDPQIRTIAIDKDSIVQNAKNNIYDNYSIDKVQFNDNEYLILHFSYTIKFEDTNIPCSWVNLYGVNYEHGWGLTVILNDREVGTICINKKFIIDTKARAILEYYQNANWHYGISFPKLSRKAINRIKYPFPYFLL